MHFLQARIAVLAFLCVLLGAAPAPGATLEGAAAGAAQAGADAKNTNEEEWQQPTRLPPMRSPQTPPAELEKSILETLLKVEEEARRQAEAEARVEAEQREREERALGLKEQQEARENARILRERRLARSKAISDAIKSAMPPPVALMPNKENWPMPGMIEDPDWNSPEILLIYQSYYDADDIKALYRLCLKEAVQGNPRAMLILSYAYGRWGSDISGSLSVLHPPMHNSGFWRRWALQLTSPDWVALRLGDLSLNHDEKAAYYEEAARQGSAEAMYKLALLEDRPELLIDAALGGHPQACSIVAFNLLQGTDGFPASPRLAAFYWWRGALAGDVRSILVCSEYFSQGQGGFPKDERRAYLFALFAFEEAQRQESYRSKSTASSVLGTAERHLDSLTVAMRLSTYEIWKIRQDLEIFKAAPQEELLSRLDELTPARKSAVRALQAELYAVSDVLASSQTGATEQQILARMEQALAQGDMENMRRSHAGDDIQRQRGSMYFVFLGIVGIALVLGVYLAVRLHLFSRIVRLVSVTNGGKA